VPQIMGNEKVRKCLADLGMRQFAVAIAESVIAQICRRIGTPSKRLVEASASNCSDRAKIQDRTFVSIQLRRRIGSGEGHFLAKCPSGEERVVTFRSAFGCGSDTLDYGYQSFHT